MSAPGPEGAPTPEEKAAAKKLCGELLRLDEQASPHWRIFFSAKGIQGVAYPDVEAKKPRQTARMLKDSWPADAVMICRARNEAPLLANAYLALSDAFDALEADRDRAVGLLGQIKREDFG